MEWDGNNKGNSSKGVEEKGWFVEGRVWHGTVKAIIKGKGREEKDWLGEWRVWNRRTEKWSKGNRGEGRERKAKGGKEIEGGAGKKVRGKKSIT